MISIKPGVCMNGVRPITLRALAAAAEVFEREGYDFVATSIKDGRHMHGSKHYSGEAFDCRSKHLRPGDKERILNLLRTVVGAEFDVLLEGLGTDNEHYHVEHDPR